MLNLIVYLFPRAGVLWSPPGLSPHQRGGSSAAAAARRRQRGGGSAAAAGSVAVVRGGGSMAERWQSGSGSMAVAAVGWQRVSAGQHGGSVGSAAAVAAERWQHGGGSVAVVAVQQQRGGGGQRSGGVGSAAAASPAARRQGRRKHASGGRLGGCGGSLAHRGVSGSSRAAGAVLPPRAATVATKTLATTAMGGALPTINNQLKAAAAMATETVRSTN
jgi:hypothetical protein